jgi:carbonic anhydrase
MRLFEAILEANNRAVAGDADAGLRPADFADALPVAALTCIDVRLNRLLPNVLGLPEDQFIWLRNAGNIITGPLSSTTRSLALACAVKGAEEICIIGHTDCQVCKTTTMQLLERLKTLGIERHMLPDNVNEYFGLFSSERQNVIKACDLVRHSPLIGAKVPVHGLLVDIETGKLEWLVKGYQTFGTMSDKWTEVVKSAGETVDKLKSLADFKIGEMKFPETKIGETVTQATGWLSQKIGELEIKRPEASPPAPGSVPAALNVAEEVIQFAQKHWPKPGGPTPKPSTPPPPPPPLPQRIPLPPRIVPQPGLKRRR